MDQQNEGQGPSLQEYWSMLRRRRWWVIVPLVAGWGLVLAASWFIPEQFKSQTVILVEQQRVPANYVQPNVTMDLQGRLQSMSEQILSRTRLLAIIQKLNLYGKDRGHLDPDSLVEQMRKDITIELVTTARGAELTAFKISYVGPSPMVVQQVTGELTSLFIDENLKTRTQASEDTTAFLENQLTEARKELDVQERRLREFKSKYLGELPEQMPSNMQILNGLQTRLSAVNDALNRDEQQRLYLESLLSQYRDLRSKTDSDTPVSLPALEARLEQLQNQLAQLSTKYTAQHPDVLSVKREIASTEALKQKIEADLANPKKSSKPEAPNAHSVAELQASTPEMQMRSQLKVNQNEIENLKRQQKQLTSEIASYESRLNLTPAREQEMAAVVRDTQQSRANYDSLLQKKLQSELATNLERRQQGEQFRVIDPPNLPQRPFWPNRLKLSLIGIGVGLVLGVGLAVVKELMDPLVYEDSQVKRLCDAEVLASVPGLWTATELQRQRRVVAVETLAASLLLLVIPLVTAYTYYYG